MYNLYNIPLVVTNRICRISIGSLNVMINSCGYKPVVIQKAVSLLV